MGLDMYLRASRYVSGYEFSEEESRLLYDDLVEEFSATELASADTPSASVEFTVAYWRKANQIHRWFVENVQDGVDDCRTYWVSREQLRELRDLCARVVASLEMEPGKVHVGTTYSEGNTTENYEDGEVAGNTELAEELLPVQDGFFFGSTDYDEWYKRDCESTVEQLDRVLKAPEGWDFEYQSSW